MPLLEEYIYNDGERLRALLGTAFMRKLKPEAHLFDVLPEAFDVDMPRYEIWRFDDDQGFLNALRRLSGVTSERVGG